MSVYQAQFYSQHTRIFVAYTVVFQTAAAAPSGKTRPGLRGLRTVEAPVSDHGPRSPNVKKAAPVRVTKGAEAAVIKGMFQQRSFRSGNS